MLIWLIVSLAVMTTGYTYILTNANRTTLYVGVTSDLVQRVYEHKSHIYKNSFTAKYNLELLVYYEEHDDIADAIAREKEIKKWRREKKVLLVETFNPTWKDLYDDALKYFMP